MADNPAKINPWLYPASWIYGTVVSLRNRLFDWQLLRSKSFNLPVICVGNLAVGGTGKTPHTEYIIRLLQDNYRTAILSRGYKRKTQGFILADKEATADTIGDEPYQMYLKYSKVQVAVDEDRCDGISRLLSQKQSPQVILLDDAFQHRYVKAGLNILLTDYNRLFCDDAMLPAGRLREPESGKERAQIVIVTKCPRELPPIQYNIIGKKLDLKPYQRLFFSTLNYGAIRPLFPEAETPGSLNGKNVLLLTGIASPAPLQKELKAQGATIELASYADHHDFSSKDISTLEARLKSMPENAVIITTEKDATRLINREDIPDMLRKKIYVIPIEISILQGQQAQFNKAIISYVRENL